MVEIKGLGVFQQLARDWGFYVDDCQPVSKVSTFFIDKMSVWELMQAFFIVLVCL